MLSLIDLFPANAKPDEASLEVELQVFRNHCLASKQGIATINDALNYYSKFKELFPLASGNDGLQASEASQSSN